MDNQITEFEQLEAWQQARRLTKEVYKLTRRGMLTKDFGLCGQIQRAAVSIMSNVAEGFGRHHPSEKLQFYNIARGSSTEVRSLLYVIEDNYPEASAEAVTLREQSSCTGRLVTGLIRSTEARKAGLIARLLQFVAGWIAA